MDLRKLEVWFVTGSQHLYGKEALDQVAEHSNQIASFLDKESPLRVIWKPVLTTPEAIRDLCLEANNAKSCAGLVLWMHTFSPAKMWIAGLSALNVPFLHLHTQFNRELPWSTIDMDFMNLNQAAHGDREFGFITARLRLARKVVVGFWQDADVLGEVATWMRAAAGCARRAIVWSRRGPTLARRPACSRSAIIPRSTGRGFHIMCSTGSTTRSLANTGRRSTSANRSSVSGCLRCTCPAGTTPISKAASTVFSL